MSCRRICRELLWRARFGELGPGSVPHLDHLADCRSCRDTVGYDRELVRQLREALAERIEAASPPTDAWYGILARTQRPEPRGWAALWTRFGALAVGLRTGTAIAGTGLALVVAMNMEVVSLAAPGTDASRPPTVRSGGLQPPPRLSLDAGAYGGQESSVASDVVVVSSWSDPEAAIPYQLARLNAAEGEEDEQGQAEERVTDTQLQVVIRVTRMPELVGVHDNGEANQPRPAPDPVEVRPGEPN